MEYEFIKWPEFMEAMGADVSHAKRLERLNAILYEKCLRISPFEGVELLMFSRPTEDEPTPISFFGNDIGEIE